MPVVSPPQSNTSRGHAHLLSHYYGINGDSPDGKDSPTTILSRKFDATHQLLEVSARLADGKDLLNDAIATITDKNATTKMSNIAINVIRKSVLPLMDIASTMSRKSANLVGPIAGVNYAHRREEVSRKKHIKSSSRKKSIRSTKIIESTGLSMVNVFVNGHAPSDKRVQLKRKVTSSDDLSPPPSVPANGVEYGVGEFLGIIKTYKKGSKLRGHMITKMLSSEYSYLKRSKSTVYTVISEHEKGRIFDFAESWRDMGRPKIMSDDEVDLFTESVRKNPGEKNMREYVNDMLIESATKKGRLCASDMKFNPTTVNNYMALFANKGGISLTEKSIAKTNARWTAEHSSIGTMALVIVVATTHFYVVATEDTEWRQFLSTLPEDSKLLYNMVSDFHGGKPVRVRSPHLITNQDDETEFICKGKQEDKSSRIGLVATTALKTQSTLSVYHQDDLNNMNGLQVKRHLLTNACGDVAPACYCFSGLTEWEMPEDEFIIWEVEGLCIGGYGAYRSTGIGYVLFMRGTPGAEKKRFRWIRDNVLIPFINWGRKEYDGVDVESGAPMGDEHTAVSWCDGDNSQIDTIVSEEGIQIYAANNIIANKHNASGTGKEQACDLGKVFPISKKLNKSTTVEHIPSSNHHLKRQLELQFSKFNSKIRIKKHSAIIDYLAKQPTILSRSCVRENVLSGYVASGSVDPMHFRMPVLFKILSTCKKVCNLNEYNKYLSSFPSLMGLSYNNGNQYLSDADFISHGFEADIDAYGNMKIRDATISQENQQRAKCLTSIAEVSKRAKRLEEIDYETRRKEQLIQSKTNQKVSEDRALISKLCAMMELEVSEDNVARCELKHFDKLKAAELKAFIVARHPKYTKLADVAHLKNPRGGKSMEDAANGVENCVSVAFGVRNEKSRLVDMNERHDDTSTTAIAVPLTSRINLRGFNCVETKPSDILKDHAKVELLISTFDPNGKLNTLTESELSTDILNKADLLFVLLKTRFNTHVKRKAYLGLTKISL
jgi:hypothetical protein